MGRKKTSIISLSVLFLIAIISAGLYIKSLNVNVNANANAQMYNSKTTGSPVYLFDVANSSSSSSSTSTTSLKSSSTTSSSTSPTSSTNSTTSTAPPTSYTTTIQPKTAIAAQLTLSQNPPINVALDSNQNYTFMVGANNGIPSSYVWSYSGGLLSKVNGCGNSNAACTLLAANVSAPYQSGVTVYALNSSGTPTNPVSWNVNINPQLSDVYADFGGANANGSYMLVSAATGGTPPYKYTWELQNLTVVKGCGTSSKNNTCTVFDNSSSSAAAILVVQDNATIPVSVVDWHATVSLSPLLQVASSEGSSAFNALVTLFPSPGKNLVSASVYYSWVSTNGLSTTSCPPSGGLSVNCNILNPVVAALQYNSIRVMITNVQAIIDNQSGNPDSSSCYKIGGSGSHQTYQCTYSSSVFSNYATLKDYPLLKTVLSANRTMITGGQSVFFTNTTTGGSGGNSYSYSYSIKSGLGSASINGNIITFTTQVNPTIFNVTLHVVDSIGETAQSFVFIAVNESLSLNGTRIKYPGVENSGIPIFSTDQKITDLNLGPLGGIPPYTYEWLIALPGSTNFYQANCGPGATGPITQIMPCLFAPNASSPLGEYHFQLQATDSETPPGSVTSSIEPFNLNASLVLSSFTCTHFTDGVCLISAGQTIVFANATAGGTGGKRFTYSGTAAGNMTDQGHETFLFNTPGTYELNLRVQDQAGENETLSLPIQVTKPLGITSKCTQEVGTGCKISTGQSVTITNSTTGGTGDNQFSYSGTAVGNMTSSGGNVWTFNTNGIYNLNINVADLSGETNTTLVVITVTPPLVFTSFTNTSRVYISSGQSVSFTNTTKGGTGDNQYTYEISCGGTGGTYSIGQNNNIEFTHSGVCTVSMQVSDESGETNTTTNSVTVTITPVLATSLIANRTLISVGQWIKFTNSTTGGTGNNIYSYGFSDSCGEVAQNQTNGNVWQFNTVTEVPCAVTFNVIDASGETNESSNTITVKPPLVITSFENVSRTYISASQSVTFTNTTTGGTGNNIWTYYVDGSPATPNSNGTLSFNSAGNYVVTLHVSDLSGEVNQSATTVNVMVTPPLVTTLFANWTYISAGQSVKFTNITTGGTGNNIFSYSIACSPLNPDWPSSNNIFRFPRSGTCVVTLHVSDASNEINESSNTITVTPPLQITSFTNTSRIYISAGQSVSFTNTTTDGTGNNVWTYFSNGIATPSSDGSVTFPSAGNYIITLGVTDLTGEVSNSLGVNVIVTPPLEITSFANTSRIYISAGQSVSFTNTTTGGTGSNVWTYFENGASTESSNGLIAFTTAGNYIITLGVTDASGEVANSLGVNVIVTPELVTTLLANRTLISVDQSVKFTNITTGGTSNNVYSYSIACSQLNPDWISSNNIFKFPYVGTCVVTLRVSDASGETSESSNTITVTPPLEIVSFGGTTPISLDQAATFTNSTTGGTGNNQFAYSILSGPEGGTFVNNGNNELMFTVPGTYVMQLGVEDISGETNTITNTIIVNPTLAVQPLPGAISIDQYQQFTYEANVVSGTGTPPYSYTWTVPTAFAVVNGCGLADSFCTVNAMVVGSNSISVTVNDMSLGTPPESNTLVSEMNVYPPLSVKPPKSGDSIIDQGQLSVESTSVVGGAPPYTSEWLFESPENLSYVLIPDSVQTSNSIITKYIFQTDANTPIGAWEFQVRVLDSSVMPEMANAINQEGVTVFPQLLANTIASPAQVIPGNSSTINSIITGGTDPSNFACQWFEEMPGSSGFSPIPAATNCNMYIFATTPGTQEGGWLFKVMVTDMGTTNHDIVNSTIAAVTVGQFGVELLGSSPAIDSGQTETLTATALEGTPPYTYQWSGPGAAACNAITSNTVLTCNVMPTTSTIPLPLQYGVMVTDSALHTQSAVFNVLVNPAPSSGFSALFNPLDSGQIETYMFAISGGTGPFLVQLYNTTSGTPVPTGFSTTIQSPGGYGGISFIVNSPTQGNLFTYNALIIDQGTLPQYTFNTVSNTILVNQALGSNVTAAPQTLDVGQSSLITVNITGGTSPYNYTYIVTNSVTGANVFVQTYSNVASTTNSLSFIATPNSIGLDNVSVYVHDKTIIGNELVTRTINGVTLQIAVNNATSTGGGGGSTGGSGGSTGSGGGGGAGTGGSPGGGIGGGGSSVPVVAYSNGCATISNVTVPNSFNFTVSGSKHIGIDNYIGYNFTSMIVDGTTYVFYLNVPQLIENGSINMTLASVNYQPIEHIVALSACPAVMQGANSSTGNTVSAAGNGNATASNAITAPVVQAPTNSTSIYTTTIRQTSQTAGIAGASQQSKGIASLSSADATAMLLIAVALVLVILAVVFSSRKRH